MLAADRQTAGGRLSANLMLSLEPFTMHDRGSPQLFQTGESYQRTPLVHFQHQHDLLMGLGVTYAFTRPRITYTPGVVRAGVGVGSLTAEASVFRGAEPDENRIDVERPRLDSWATRVRWRRGPWDAQVSGGRLRQPEWFEPYDATRITASVSFDGQVRSRPLAMTLAWGENRQFNGFNGNVDGFLLEADLRATAASAVYGRVEVTAKELFGLGPHPKEFAHRHWFSDVRAPDILRYFGSSRSFHVFLRWRPQSSVPQSQVPH
jgi:hypothetical protein